MGEAVRPIPRTPFLILRYYGRDEGVESGAALLPPGGGGGGALGGGGGAAAEAISFGSLSRPRGSVMLPLRSFVLFQMASAHDLGREKSSPFFVITYNSPCFVQSPVPVGWSVPEMKAH